MWELPHFEGMDEEIRAHIEAEVEENLDRGMTPEAARTAALRKFGNVAAVREQTWAVWHRVWLQELEQDLRYAVRQLRLAPVFTLTVILTLGLGIGATTAIFSLVNSVMLKSLPVADPVRLYRIGSGNDCCSSRGLQGDWQTFSYSLYKQLERSAPEFDSLAAFQNHANTLSVRDGGENSQARPVQGEYVSGNYFETFGLKPYLGRLFTRADEQRNAAPVVVLSYRAWQQSYHASASVIGMTLHIETYPFTIVGVAPPGFFGETLSDVPPEMWIPLETELLTDGKDAFILIPSHAWLHLIGHLRPGAAAGGLPSELTSALQHWIETDAMMPLQNRPQSAEELARQRIQLSPGGSGIGTMREQYAGSLWLLFGLCLAVLLIACANIANLLLTRGIARRPQVALQLALGAARGRMMRQALTESLLLALLGGVVGAGIAWLGAKLMVALAFRHADVPIDVRPSLPVLGFCFVLSLVTGVLFGMAPAWLASRTNPIELLRGAKQSMEWGASLPQRMLIVLQAAISVVLVAAAGMLTHSMGNLQNQNLGFATVNRVIVQIEPPLAEYTFEALNARYRDLLARLSQVPGVHSASLALSGPIAGGWNQTIVRPGEGMPPPNGSHSALWDRVSAGYFQTMGIPVLAGREISEADRAETRGVVVVNAAFVRKFFPDGQVIGRHFGLSLPAYSNSLEVVGVVGDTLSGELREAAKPIAYGALSQRVAYAEETMQSTDKWDHFINGAQISFTGDLGVAEPALREAFRQVDPNFAIVRIDPMQRLVDAQFDQERAVAQLSGLFGGLALLLASIGLYGVTAYTVARRTGEIGIRMAIGANRLSIVGLVLRGVFAQVALGLAIGVPVALLVGTLMAAQLYNVRLWDVRPLGLAVGTLLLGASVASFLPARRAAGIDPMEALRAE